MLLDFALAHNLYCIQIVDELAPILLYFILMASHPSPSSYSSTARDPGVVHPCASHMISYTLSHPQPITASLSFPNHSALLLFLLSTSSGNLHQPPSSFQLPR